MKQDLRKYSSNEAAKAEVRSSLRLLADRTVMIYVTPVKYGFTLLEVTIAVGIIAILSIAGLFSYRGVFDRSKVNEATSTLQAIRGAVEAYYADIGFYPPSFGAGKNPTDRNRTCSSGCPAGWSDAFAQEPPPPGKWRGPYLSFPGIPDDELPQTSWGGEYRYDYQKGTTSLLSCTYFPGVYITIEGPVPAYSEDLLRRQGFDSCPGDNDGQVRMLIKSLQP